MRVLGVSLWGLLLGLLLNGTVGGAAAHEGAQRAPSHQQPELVVLHQWDTARQAAYDHNDQAALRGLYVPGSTAGSADIGMLRQYAARGLRVHGLTSQVLSARVTISRDDQIRLVVVDRLSGGYVSGPTGCWRLPRDRARTQAIDFRKISGRWQVAAVTATS